MVSKFYVVYKATKAFGGQGLSKGPFDTSYAAELEAKSINCQKYENIKIVEEIAEVFLSPKVIYHKIMLD